LQRVPPGRRDDTLAHLGGAASDLSCVCDLPHRSTPSGHPLKLRQNALGVNGRLMTDLVPELKPIIGDQPPVSELPPRDAQQRFQRVLQRFIGVFARPEHPLALFLDDLQWLDVRRLTPSRMC
jgi:hypothetical protein